MLFFMSIPLYSFLIAYLLFLLVFVVYYILIVYQIHTSASFTFFSFFVTFFLGICSILTISFTWNLLSTVDWKKRIVIFENNSLTVFEKTPSIPLYDTIPGMHDEVDLN